jgi:hypothetical protein
MRTAENGGGIKLMVTLGIIERVFDPSDWVSPSLVIPKSNGSVRLVVDFTSLNKYVKRLVHPFSSAMDISTSIPPSVQMVCCLGRG